MTKVQAKRVGRSEREMNTPLFLLHCVEIGVSISNLAAVDLWLNLGYNKATEKEEYRCRLSLCAI